MLLVALSVAFLLAAPLVAALLAKSASLAALLDSFVLVAVFGIVGLHVLPQSATIGGAGAILAVVAGVLLPIALHRLDARLSSSSSSSRTIRDTTLLLALSAGLFVHGMFDGTALTGASATPSLALAVLLHRLPAGLAFWTVVRPALGMTRMLVVVAAYAAGTCTGALASDALATSTSLPALALVQAFVGGSILHIVAESAPWRPLASTTTTRIAGVVGAAVAAVGLFVMEALEGAHAAATTTTPDALHTFVALALLCAPATLLSFVLVGLLTALYPDGVPRLPRPRTRIVDAVVGVAAGLPHPLCSCTVEPLYTSLVDRGASPSSARAFLAAAPELGVPAVLLSARLFGLPFAGARALGAALLALVVGLTSAGQRRRAAMQSHPEEAGDASSSSSSSSSSSEPTEPTEPFSKRLTRGMRHGIVDAVDHVGPWLLLGLAVAALLEPALVDRTPIMTDVSPGHGSLGDAPPLVVTTVAAVAALPLYLCAAGSTPVAAMLVHKGASLGAALAFLLVGPATSLPTLSLLKRLHGTRAAVTFAVVVVAGAVAVGAGVDWAVERVSYVRGLRDALDALDFHAYLSPLTREPHVYEIVCAVVVAALLGASLVRQGVRGFLVQIMSPQHTHAGDHDHGPGCGHDHGPPVAPPLFGGAIRPMSSSPSSSSSSTGPKARVALTFDPRGPRDEP